MSIIIVHQLPLSMLRQIQTINKHILRMPHNIQAGWSNFFTQHLATRYTKLPNHPPSSWFPRFNLWHMGLSKNSVSQSHQIIIIFPTQKKWWDAPFKTHPIILFTGRILMKWLAYTSMISPYYWWDSILCKKWLDTPKDIPNNPPLSSKWVILLV